MHKHIHTHRDIRLYHLPRARPLLPPPLLPQPHRPRVSSLTLTHSQQNNFITPLLRCTFLQIIHIHLIAHQLPIGRQHHQIRARLRHLPRGTEWPCSISSPSSSIATTTTAAAAAAATLADPACLLPHGNISPIIKRLGRKINSHGSQRRGRGCTSRES